MGTCVVARARRECDCFMCRSPRGGWRCDSIEASVGQQLEQLAAAVRSDAFAQSPWKEPASVVQPEHTPERQLPRRGTWREESPNFRTITESVMDTAAWQPPRSRPASAPTAGLRQVAARRPKGSEHVREVFQRHVEMDAGLQERRRAAWDAKMAAIDSRLADRGARAAELRHARQFDARLREDEALRRRLFNESGDESPARLRWAQSSGLECANLTLLPGPPAAVEPHHVPSPRGAARTEAFQKWSTLMTCLRAVIILRRMVKLRRAADVVKEFTPAFDVHGRFHLALSHLLNMVRRVQRFWRRRALREFLRRELSDRMFRGAEEVYLKRVWAEEDKALIHKERRRLLHIRGVKEMQSCERVIRIATENYQRHRSPKTEADHIYVRRQLDKQKLPAPITLLCSRLAIAARKLLLRFEFRNRQRRLDAYRADLQAWQDIEQAVQLLDPSNHNSAPRPERPAVTRFPLVLEDAALSCCVRRLHLWYREFQGRVDAQVTAVAQLLPETPLDCEQTLIAALATPGLGCVAVPEHLSPRGLRQHDDAADIVLEVASIAFEPATLLPPDLHPEDLHDAAATYVTVCAAIMGLTLLPLVLREQVADSVLRPPPRPRRTGAHNLSMEPDAQVADVIYKLEDEIVVPGSPTVISF